MEETMYDYTFEEALRAKVEAIAKACQAIVEWLKPIAKAIQKFFKALDKFVYQWYLAEGAKYGKSRKGRDRWLDEKVAENRLKQEAEVRAMRAHYLEEMRRDGFELGRRIARGKLELEE